MASSSLAFQLSLLSDIGLLAWLPLDVRTGILDGRSAEVRFNWLLFSMSRSGEFSLSERGMDVDGGSGTGELLFFFDRKPALNRLFFGMLNVASGAAGIGDALSGGLMFLVATGIPRGIGDALGRGGSLGLGSPTFSF